MAILLKFCPSGEKIWIGHSTVREVVVDRPPLPTTYWPDQLVYYYLCVVLASKELSNTLLVYALDLKSQALNPFAPKSDQCQISPAASPEMLHHTVWRLWRFIAYSDERWSYYQFSLPHLFISSYCVMYNISGEAALRSERKGLERVINRGTWQQWEQAVHTVCLCWDFNLLVSSFKAHELVVVTGVCFVEGSIGVRQTVIRVCEKWEQLRYVGIGLPLIYLMLW